jgi:folate-binding protein YgfZ
VTAAPCAEVVGLDGPDALDYLQSQVSQDLAGIGTDGQRRTLLLDPNGTIVAVGSVHLRTEGHLELEVPLGLGTAVRDRLARFAIRTDVTFTVSQVESTADAALLDERSRIDAGIPGPRELANGLVAHGLDPALFEASVSFTKGCYPGQELVARMQARSATPPYVLRHLTLDAAVEVSAAVGDTTFEGRVTSVVAAGPSQWHALCVLHRRDAAGNAVDVHAASGVVRAKLD